jgi:hypothetical protein
MAWSFAAHLLALLIDLLTTRHHSERAKVSGAQTRIMVDLWMGRAEQPCYLCSLSRDVGTPMCYEL